MMVYFARNIQKQNKRQGEEHIMKNTQNIASLIAKLEYEVGRVNKKGK